MKGCQQNKQQTIYQHGLSVQKHYFELIRILRGSEATTGKWIIPDWLPLYKEEILKNLLPESIIASYTLYHDVGKPFCIEHDENGKVHFPDHANVSYNIWMQTGGDSVVGELIRRDMEIHLLKSKDVPEFCSDPKMAITLLLAGLAEVHSNAQMFGGIESESFKIKFKQINKRGKSICEFLFKKDK